MKSRGEDLECGQNLSKVAIFTSTVATSEYPCPTIFWGRPYNREGLEIRDGWSS